MENKYWLKVYVKNIFFKQVPIMFFDYVYEKKQLLKIKYTQV